MHGARRKERATRKIRRPMRKVPTWQLENGIPRLYFGWRRATAAAKAAVVAGD